MSSICGTVAGVARSCESSDTSTEASYIDKAGTIYIMPSDMAHGTDRLTLIAYPMLAP